jgi:hypothetical protein
MYAITPYTITTVASSAYTLYKVHPFVPYKIIWESALVPGVCLLFSTIKRRVKLTPTDVMEHNNVEFYEVITKSDEFGIVTKHLIFEDEPQFTFLGVEYVEKDDMFYTGPVFL